MHWLMVCIHCPVYWLVQCILSLYSFYKYTKFLVFVFDYLGIYIYLKVVYLFSVTYYHYLPSSCCLSYCKFIKFIPLLVLVIGVKLIVLYLFTSNFLVGIVLSIFNTFSSYYI